MEKKVYPLYHGTNKMTWGKGTVLKGAKGFVFLAGTEGIDPTVTDPWPAHDHAGEIQPKVVEGIEAQTRMCLEKIKSRLEELGSSLDNIVKMITYVKGPEFPDGVAYSANWQKALKVRDDFFGEHCPDLLRNPVPNDLIGVSGLGLRDMLIEIACIAVIPDD